MTCLTSRDRRAVHEPHVRFLKGRIEFAGRAGDGGPLISIEMSVSQTADGPRVSLGRPWAGRLPLTRSLIARAAGEVEGTLRDSSMPDETILFLKHLIAGEAVAPIVAVPSSVVGQRELLPARVEKLTIEDGVLRATLRPIGTAH